MQGNCRLSERAPCTHRFFHDINRGLMLQGIESIADRMPNMLGRSGAFVDIVSRDLSVPVGSWDHGQQRVGEGLKNNLIVFATSMKLWLVEKGYFTRAEAQALVDGLRHEVDTVGGMVLKYRITFARKA